MIILYNILILIKLQQIKNKLDTLDEIIYYKNVTIMIIDIGRK